MRLYGIKQLPHFLQKIRASNKSREVLGHIYCVLGALPTWSHLCRHDHISLSRSPHEVGTIIVLELPMRKQAQSDLSPLFCTTSKWQQQDLNPESVNSKTMLFTTVLYGIYRQNSTEDHYNNDHPWITPPCIYAPLQPVIAAFLIKKWSPWLHPLFIFIFLFFSESGIILWLTLTKLMAEVTPWEFQSLDPRRLCSFHPDPLGIPG